MTTVTISNETHVRLVRMKDEKLTSIDKVLVYLLDKTDPEIVDGSSDKKIDDLERKLEAYHNWELAMREAVEFVLDHD